MYPCTEATDSEPHCTCKNTTNGTHDKRFRQVFCKCRLQRTEKGRAASGHDSTRNYPRHSFLACKDFIQKKVSCIRIYGEAAVNLLYTRLIPLHPIHTKYQPSIMKSYIRTNSAYTNTTGALIYRGGKHMQDSSKRSETSRIGNETHFQHASPHSVFDQIGAGSSSIILPKSTRQLEALQQQRAAGYTLRAESTLLTNKAESGQLKSLKHNQNR